MDRLPVGLADSPSRGQPIADFPSQAMREQLYCMGIASLFHERAWLLAMIERRTGLQPSQDQTADQLAGTLIALEKGRARKPVDSVLSGYATRRHA